MTKRICWLVLLSASLSAFSLLTTSCGGGAFSSTGGNSGGGGAAALEITTASLPAGTVGTAYSTDLQAKGGKAPYAWTIKSSTLPPGLSLSATGAITGTPTLAGTVDALIFEVTDANKNTATSANLNLKISLAAPPRVMTTSLPNGTVGFAYAASLQASGGKPPYAWSVKAGTLPAGVSFSSTGAITGTPTASGDFSSLVFAVIDANRSVGDSADLNLHIASAPVPQITTTSLPSGEQGTAYSFALQATGGSGVYTWSLQSGALPAGLSLNTANGAISGTPTVPGIFKPLVFKVTDADTATAVSNNLSLQVYNSQGCSAGTESNLGTQPYAFLIKGFDPTGPLTAVGTFTPDGKGGITSGEEDINSNLGELNGFPITPAGSSYTLGADNSGCLTLASSVGATTFRFSVGGVNGSGAFTTGHIIVFDDTTGTGTRGSGFLRLQDSAGIGNGLQSMFALQLTGTNAGSGHFGMVGSFQVAGGGNFDKISLDLDNAGQMFTNLKGVTGSYSTPDASGRGTAQFAAAGFSLNMVYYIVSANELLFASTDPLSINPIVSGEALSTVGPFSAASLKGEYVGHGIGGSTNGPVAMVATGSFDGVGVVSGGTITQDRGGAVTQGAVAANYVVDSATGRVSFSNNSIVPVAYLVTNYPGVSAFLVGNDFPATSGVIEPQTSTNPAAGIFSMGTEEVVDYETVNQVGTLNLTSQNFSGTTNLDNPVAPYLVMDQSVPTTAFTFGSLGGTFGANTVAVTSGSAVYYIDESAGAHPSVTAVTK